MNFKLTKQKIILSIVVILIWYFFLVSIRPGFCTIYDCGKELCPSLKCEELTYNFHLYPECPLSCCECPTQTTFFELFAELLVILFPGLIIYIVWSLYMTNKKGETNETKEILKSKKNNKER